MLLNDEQKLAVLDAANSILLTAPPGSGKTATLIARALSEYEVLPDNKMIALITYTNAGADEISNRIEYDSTKMFIGTIHSFCLNYILRPFGWKAGWRSTRIIQFSEMQEFVSTNFEFSEINWIEELGKIQLSLDGTLNQVINWNNRYSFETVASRYFEFLESRGAIDFNEVIRRSLRLIHDFEFIRNSLASKFHELLVDEFQDTSEFQYQIIKAICDGGMTTTFLVGDPRQQILTFAGYIEGGFDRVAKELGCKQYRLTKTYRSSNVITSSFQKLFPSDPGFENLSSVKDAGIPLQTISLQNTTHSIVIGRLIDAMISSGIKPNEIAILSTSWFDCLNISRDLRRRFRLSGIGALPHRSVNSTGFSLLRSIFKYHTETNLRNFKTLKRNLSRYLKESNFEPANEDFQSIISGFIDEISKINESLSLSDGLRALKFGFESLLPIEHSVFDELFAREHDELFSQWTIQEYADALSGKDSIFVNTIHSSKGMEFDAVVMYCADEFKIPHQTWDRDRQMRLSLTADDEYTGRKLFYVAMSRSRKVLIITNHRNPSAFTHEVTIGSGES